MYKDLANFFNTLLELGQLFTNELEKYQDGSYENEKKDSEVVDKKMSEEIKNTKDSKENVDISVKEMEMPAEGSYTYTYTDYSVNTFEDEQKELAKHLNNLVFTARCKENANYKAYFVFNTAFYQFMWDVENDKFVGVRRTENTEEPICWNEQTNSVESCIPEKAKDEKKYVKKGEASDVKVEELDPSSDTECGCEFRGNLFYPYGEKCKGCKFVNECFSSEEELTNCSTPSKEAVYAADGDAIDETEIPSLTDYTTQAAEEHESSICGVDLYNELNANFQREADKYLHEVLDACEKLLKYKAFKVVKEPGASDINEIWFTYDQIESALAIDLPTDENGYPLGIEEFISDAALQAAIENKFSFNCVRIRTTSSGKEVHCELI